ncbi:MAG: helix-turn-helix domain-containing protein [Corynebacterium glutamicum]|nr:helix-turn-helix domain-containing protein [Corynebacterium glutamicum]
MSDPKTYTVKEAARVLGVKESTLYEQLRNGRAEDLKPFRLGGWRLPRRTVDAKANGLVA